MLRPAFADGMVWVFMAERWDDGRPPRAVPAAQRRIPED